MVELTASEAEINQFVSYLGERTDIVEVVRSGALAVGRNARALHVVRKPRRGVFIFRSATWRRLGTYY